MLINLALAIAPAVCSPQDNATLHTAKADLFVDVPDVAALIAAWQETAIAKIAMDDDMEELLAIAGISGPEQLLEKMSDPQLQLGASLLSNAKGLSISASLNDGALGEVLDELRMFVTSSQAADLEFLHNLIEGRYLNTGELPSSLDGLGVGESFLFDAYGNRFYYQPSADGAFALLALGADGELGGVGASQDLPPNVALAPLLASRLASLAGAQLVIEWHHPELVSTMLGAAVGRLQAELPFLQAASLEPTEPKGGTSFPATSYRVNPSDLGAPEGSAEIEFSLQMSGNRTIATFGSIRGQDVTDPLKKTLAGEISPLSLAADPNYQRAMQQAGGGEGLVAWRGFINTVKSAATGAHQSQAGFDPYAAILDYLGFTEASGGWVTRLDRGLYPSERYIGALPSQIRAEASIAKVAEWIPNDAVLVQAGPMDPGGMLELLRGVGLGRGNLDELLDSSEVDIQGGLIDNLGSEFAFWMNPAKGLSVPEIFIVIPVTNGETLMSALDGLCDKLVEAESDFSISRRPYKKVNYTSLNVGIPIGVTPTFAILDGNLWVSNSSILLKREIRRRSKGDDYERGSHPLFQRVKGEAVELPSNLRSAGYMDLGGILSSYYRGALMMSGMIGGGINLPPGLLDSLPSEGVFTRHIAPTFSETRLDDGALITHKVGAFGPEPIVLGLAGLYAGYTLAGRLAEFAGPWEAIFGE